MSLILNRFRNWPTVLCPSNFDDARGTRVVFYSLMKQRIITCSQFTCNQKWNQSNALWTLTTTIVIGEPKLHWVITEHITTRSSVIIHNQIIVPRDGSRKTKRSTRNVAPPSFTTVSGAASAIRILISNRLWISIIKSLKEFENICDRTRKTAKR